MRIGNVMLALMFALAAPAADPASTGSWERLGQLAGRKTVKVYLRDGRVVRGKVQQFGPEGLALLEPKDVAEVYREDITRLSGDLQVGGFVELQLRDGRELTGTVQELGEEAMLVEFGRIVQLKREDVVRVTARVRGLTAVVGDKKMNPVLVGLVVAMSAGFGAAIGAAIGHTVTLYEAERAEPQTSNINKDRSGVCVLGRPIASGRG